MTLTSNAITNWSNGLITIEELIQAAKSEGYKLSRENNVIHATGKNSFSKRIG